MRFTLLLVYVPLIALGTVHREPIPEVYASHKGSFIVRIEPGKYVKKPTPSLCATVRVFEFNSRANTYQPRATFKLENEVLPGKVHITEDGSRIVAVDDWYNEEYQKPVIVIHDGAGAVIKRFRLNELLSPAEIDELRPRRGQLHWAPWKINTNLMLNSNTLFVMRDRIAKGSGKKFDNFFIDLKSFKVEKETLE